MPRCHGVQTVHLAAPDTACATCHFTLAQATALTAADVKGFPAPPSHDAPGFMGAGGHGALANAGTGTDHLPGGAELRHLSRAGLLHHLPRERS